MKVRLNLATAPLQSHRRFLAGAALAGTLAVAVLAWLSYDVARTWRANRAERAEIAVYERQLDQLGLQRQQLAAFFGAPKAREVMDRAAFINSLIDQRSFPWTKIFMDLEHTLPPGVRVISIAPAMQKGQVQVDLVIGAESDASKLQFLDALEHSPDFSGIQVRSERRTAQPGEASEVQLELVALYSST
jgi:Tfp pilus assembly protein PilN